MTTNSKTASSPSSPSSPVPATPVWCQIGSTVAITDDSRHSRSVNTAKVLRIGKRDIVLDNGDRFSAQYLARRVGGTYGHNIHLADPASPQVAKMRAEIRRSNLVWKAKVKCEDFRYDKNGVTAEDVIRALAPLLDNGDDILNLLPAVEES